MPPREASACNADKAGFLASCPDGIVASSASTLLGDTSRRTGLGLASEEVASADYVWSGADKEAILIEQLSDFEGLKGGSRIEMVEQRENRLGWVQSLSSTAHSRLWPKFGPLQEPEA